MNIEFILKVVESDIECGFKTAHEAIENPQIRNPTKVSERCGPNRQECDFSSSD